MRFEFTCKFWAQEHDLEKVQLLLPDGRGKFPFSGTASAFLRLIADNINRVFSGWTVGETGEKGLRFLTFEYENCWNALIILSETYSTEFTSKTKQFISVKSKSPLF